MGILPCPQLNQLLALQVFDRAFYLRVVSSYGACLDVIGEFLIEVYCIFFLYKFLLHAQQVLSP